MNTVSSTEVAAVRAAEPHNRVERIVALAAQGLTAEAIAHRVDLTPDHVRIVLENADVSVEEWLRRRGGRGPS